MFDLKKRNSLTLSCSRDAEEFRRVAVRRKVKSAAVHAVSSGVRGSYSSGHSSVCGSNTELPADEDIKRSPGKGSLLKPQVSPKSVHLQSPLKAQARSPTTGRLNGTEYDQSPNRADGVSCDSPVQDSLGSPTSVRRGLNSPGKGVTLSPVRHTRGAPHIITSPVFGSHCPSKRGSQSPLKDSGHSPKLSTRNQSLLTGKLRTPSPVQGKMGSYSPGRISKSWLGLHRIPSSNMDGQEKQAAKSLSVPDLIVYLDDNRDRSEKSEFSPRKLPQPTKCSQPALTIKAPVSHRLCQSTDNGEEQSSQETRDAEEEDFTAVCVNGSDERLDNKTSETEGEQTDERGADNARDEENTEQKLYKIANELLQTERAYVARLHLLDQVFCSQLTEEAGRGSFPAEVIKNIFSNISSIYSFHSQFLLPDLENCLRHWNDSPGLGNVLLQHAPFLRMYADYVMNFDQAMELLRTWNERSSAFRNIIQDIQSQEVCGCLKLQHHMLEPVQRVPRYELLLRDYLKKLPKDDPDYELAHKSLQTISMAATHSNSAISKAERIKRLLEIYEMVGDEEVVNPTNEFLKEGRLLKLAARNTSSMERHLFLFNNFLLCCTPKFSLVGQRFTVRCRIGVDGMQVQQTTNEDHPYSFQVSGKERTLELQASSEQDRDEWIKVTQEAIDVFQKKNATFKLVSKELNVDHTTEELGRRAPRWIRDHEVNLCMKCQEPFNAFTRRRHHCRACGCVVCWKCSDNKVALEYDGNKLNKVCKSCYSILTGQRGEKLDGKKRRSLETKMPLQSSESLMSSFLYYGDDPKTWQQVWCVIARSEPMTLSLYAAPQDVMPVSCIPLLGCDLEDTPQEHQGQLGFCINQSRTTHTFSCDTSDLKQTWLAVLKDTMSEYMLEGKHNGCDSATSSSKCETNADVKYEESTINGNMERSS